MLMHETNFVTLAYKKNQILDKLPFYFIYSLNASGTMKYST